MIPLFLMLKGMGLVNSWIGVLIPFVAQHIRYLPGSAVCTLNSDRTARIGPD